MIEAAERQSEAAAAPDGPPEARVYALARNYTARSAADRTALACCTHSQALDCAEDSARTKAAGGHAVPFFPLLWKRRPFTLNLRNHRKLLVADGEVGYVGGRNIADEYRLDRVERSRRWYDAMMEVRGPAVDHSESVLRSAQRE